MDRSSIDAVSSHAATQKIYGVNYNKTFAPTAKWKSVCILLFLAAIYDWNVEGLDVEAYLVLRGIPRTLHEPSL
jgi:hypothetical protein